MSVQDLDGFTGEFVEVLGVLAEWALEFEDQEQSETAVSRETAVWQVVEMASDLLQSALLLVAEIEQAAASVQPLYLPATQDHKRKRR